MTQRTRIRRYPERAVPHQAADILAQGLVAHVGFCQNRQPFVIPFSYHYDSATPRALYLHGAAASRSLRQLARGASVCVTVTLLDALIYSRTAMDHTMNYRSVVCFGRARRITRQAEKAAILERMIQRYFPGRTAGRDYDPPSPAHLRRTTLVEIQIEDWSAKARRGGPNGPRDADPEAPGTCGVVPCSGFLYRARSGRGKRT